MPSFVIVSNTHAVNKAAVELNEQMDISLALQIAALVCGLASIFLIYWRDKDEEHKKGRGLTIAALILNMLVPLVLVFAAWKDSHDDDKKTTTLIGSITGGESYPSVLFSPYPGQPKMIYFNVYNKGEFPLYDVTIRFMDENWTDVMLASNSNRVGDLSSVEYGRLQYNIGSFDKHAGPFFLNLPPEPLKKVYIYRVTARNGSWQGRLELLKETNHIVRIYSELRKQGEVVETNGSPLLLK